MRIPHLAVSFLAATLVACGGEPPLPEADPTSRRALSTGDVVGFTHTDRDAHVWRGIPFAKPPVGELRWRAPRPPEPWDGVREAIAPGNECVQFDPASPEDVIGSEDCLVLDVYAPRTAAGAVPTDAERKPVMVWIHGGGNAIGSARMYDASRIAVDGDVIVVAIQYRLGVLGWLSHPALRASAETPDDASGNFANLDTIRALEWVRDEIGAFGGDPGNVTIFGESAGGMNVFALLLSPRAKGLFHRAISQSGVLVSTPVEQAEGFATDDDPRLAGAGEFLLRWLVQDGRADDREAARTTLAGMEPAQIESYLRGKSAEALLRGFDASMMGGMYFVPQMIRDGHVIAQGDPLEALADPERHNAVPTIAGTNREETKLFAMMSSPHVRKTFGIPTGVSDELGFDLEGEYGGLLWKAQGADQPLAAMRRGGRDDLWGYRFDWDEEGQILWVDLAELLGASHAIDLLFVFGFTDLGSWTDNVFADPESAEELGRRMRSYWTHFARTGAPGGGRDGTLPTWEPWADGRYLLFDSDAGGGLRHASDTVTVPAVAERLASDERVRDVEERCALYRNFVQYTDAFDRDDYAAFLDGACDAWPLDLAIMAGG